VDGVSNTLHGVSYPPDGVANTGSVLGIGGGAQLLDWGARPGVPRQRCRPGPHSMSTTCLATFEGGRCDLVLEIDLREAWLDGLTITAPAMPSTGPTSVSVCLHSPIWRARALLKLTDRYRTPSMTA